MANLQSQIDILAKALVNEHIGFEEFKENNKGSVTLSEIERSAKVYNAIGDKIIDDNGGGVLENYKEESYELEVNRDGKVSTRIFTYSGDESNFSGFWLYDNDKHNYAINDRGKIITSNSVDPYLKRGTFVRRIGLNEGEIGETQNNKNGDRMVYINNNILVNKTLLSYDKNTLIIDSKPWIGHYYVEFNDLEGNEIQLIVNSDLKSIIYSNKSGYKVDTTDLTDKNFNILYTDSDSNDKIVYVYRSRNISQGEFVNNADTLLAAHLASDIVIIATGAFANCTKLTQVTMSDSVKTISNNAFASCTELKKVTISSNTETIGDYAFYGCTGLTRVTIPENITTIGDNAFYDCTGLTQVTIPENITIINSGAFAGCTGLTQVTIPNSVKTINTGAFAGCTGLTQVTIPENVTTINASVFYDCTALKKVIIEDKLEIVGEKAFNTNSSELIIYCDDKNTKTLILNDANKWGYSVSVYSLNDYYTKINN